MCKESKWNVFTAACDKVQQRATTGVIIHLTMYCTSLLLRLKQDSSSLSTTWDIPVRSLPAGLPLYAPIHRISDMNFFNNYMHR